MEPSNSQPPPPPPQQQLLINGEFNFQQLSNSITSGLPSHLMQTQQSSSPSVNNLVPTCSTPMANFQSTSSEGNGGDASIMNPISLLDSMPPSEQLGLLRTLLGVGFLDLASICNQRHLVTNLAAAQPNIGFQPTAPPPPPNAPPVPLNPYQVYRPELYNFPVNMQSVLQNQWLLSQGFRQPIPPYANFVPVPAQLPAQVSEVQQPQQQLQQQASGKTIELFNTEDIDTVQMEDDFDLVENNTSQTFLDLDYNLTKQSINSNDSHDDDDLAQAERQYWETTKDCDERNRSDPNEDEVDKFLNQTRQLSRKKANRLKKRKGIFTDNNQSKTTRITKATDNQPKNSSNVSDADSDIDQHSLSELIGMYAEIRETLGLPPDPKTSSGRLSRKVAEKEDVPKISSASLGPGDLSDISDDDNLEELAEPIPMIDMPANDILPASTSNNNIASSQTPNIPPQQHQPLVGATLRDVIGNSLLLSMTDEVYKKNEHVLRENLLRKILSSKTNANAAANAPAEVGTSSAGIADPSLPNFQRSVSLPNSTGVKSINPVGGNSNNQTNNNGAAQSMPKIRPSDLNIVFSDSETDSDTPEKDEAEPTPGSSNAFNGHPIISNLSRSQQEEYAKLKNKLERREKANARVKAANLKAQVQVRLGKMELMLKQSLDKRQQKMEQCSQLISKKGLLTKQWEKDSLEVEKARQVLRIATEKYNKKSRGVNALNKQIFKIRKSINADRRRISTIKQACLELGKKVSGDEYVLPQPSNIMKLSPLSLQLRIKTRAYLTPAQEDPTSVMQLNLYTNFNFALLKSSNFARTGANKLNFNLSSLIDKESIELVRSKENEQDIPPMDFAEHTLAHPNNSILAHFNSYRFASHRTFDALSSQWSNSLNAVENICIFDLTGNCNDASCQFQHKRDYVNTVNEKLLDLLTYLPPNTKRIDLSKHRGNPQAIKQMLLNYIKSELAKKGQTAKKLAEEVIAEIKQSIKPSSSACLLVRSLPKEFIKFKSTQETEKKLDEDIYFSDYLYDFSFKAGSLRLKPSDVISNLTAANDPDIGLKYRYFAPQGGVPITAQLEALLSNEPHNVEKWIKLAYCYISKCQEDNSDGSNTNVGHCLDSALNVLSRALELNNSNTELNEQYLLFYWNKLELMNCLSKEKNNATTTTTTTTVPINKMCLRMLKYCRSYRIWLCYLNLSLSLEDKQKILDELIDELCNDKITFPTPLRRSFYILEIIFHKMNFLFQLNQDNEALKFFLKIFSREEGPTTPADDDGLRKLYGYVSEAHRAFAWLCYIHLMLYRRLPSHCFSYFRNNSFFHLVSTNYFVFNYYHSIPNNDYLPQIEGIFERALLSCCDCALNEKRQRQQEAVEVADQAINIEAMADDDDDDNNCRGHCFILRLNQTMLKQYKKSIVNESEPHLDVDRWTELYKHNPIVMSHFFTWKLFNFDVFSRPETLGECGQPSVVGNQAFLLKLKCQLKLNYWNAFYYYKLNDMKKCRRCLHRNLSLFLDNNPAGEDDGEQILEGFQQLLLLLKPKEKEFNASLPEQIEGVGPKYLFGDKEPLHSIYFYLSYL